MLSHGYGPACGRKLATPLSHPLPQESSLSTSTIDKIVHLSGMLNGINIKPLIAHTLHDPPS